jgi:hypothetical protein
VSSKKKPVAWFRGHLTLVQARGLNHKLQGDATIWDATTFAAATARFNLDLDLAFQCSTISWKKWTHRGQPLSGLSNVRNRAIIVLLLGGGVMNVGKATWQLLRVSRWALWLAFLGYCFYVYAFREGQYNQFGHLPFSTELTIFGLATAAVFAGLLEMMMRERAGIPRPSYRASSHPAPQPRGRA